MLTVAWMVYHYTTRTASYGFILPAVKEVDTLSRGGQTLSRTHIACQVLLFNNELVAMFKSGEL
jgi:hypothetical protein